MTPDRIKTPDAFWKAVEHLSIRRSALLREAGLPVSIINSEARMSTAQFFALWRAMERLGGADIGHNLSTELHGSTMPPSFSTSALLSNAEKKVSSAIATETQSNVIAKTHNIFMRDSPV